MALTASVVISTKNRRDDLRVALRSAVAQMPPVEVLVFDDGSTDGTAEMVAAEFPSVRAMTDSVSHGYIARRNQLVAAAATEVVISIDDDAAFSTPSVVAQTLRDFTCDRIGAVAIPFVNVRQSDVVHQRSPDPETVWVTDTYIGTAHALRRELFLRVGGYRPGLIHFGEERDYAARMIDAGRVVRLGRSDPIHHFESPRRDFRRMAYYGRRNDVLFSWQNVPMPDLVLHFPATVFNGLRTAFRVGQRGRMLSGLAAGGGAILRDPASRRPMGRSRYRLYRRLKRGGPMPLAAVEKHLPSLYDDPRPVSGPAVGFGEKARNPERNSATGVSSAIR